ncbi:MAG TPA: hypothetical protein VKB75_05920 [Jatrophihabitans sp.]|nr:hypothetical protein [Jatrophihabitans sp.]
MTARTDRRRLFGLTGVLLVLAGALIVLLAYRYLDWYSVAARGADSAGKVDFGKLRASADQLGGAGVATAYFDWLGWLLVIALIVVGVGANLVNPATDLLRVVGFLVGMVGAGATYYALAQHFNATGSKHSVFYNSTWGLWLTLAGFVFGAVGAALGPRSVR